jgi:hypothetical protein
VYRRLILSTRGRQQSGDVELDSDVMELGSDAIELGSDAVGLASDTMDGVVGTLVHIGCLVLGSMEVASRGVSLYVGMRDKCTSSNNNGPYAALGLYFRIRHALTRTLRDNRRKKQYI